MSRVKCSDVYYIQVKSRLILTRCRFIRDLALLYRFFIFAIIIYINSRLVSSWDVSLWKSWQMGQVQTDLFSRVLYWSLESDSLRPLKWTFSLSRAETTSGLIRRDLLSRILYAFVGKTRKHYAKKGAVEGMKCY